MAIDFFNYTTDIRKYAPQMKTDSKIDEFQPYIRPKKQIIIRLIGQDTYTKIKTDFDDATSDPILVLGIEYMQASLANLMAVPYFKFDAQERNNTENNLFRYQENAQIEEYIENSWTELDNLLEHLEANPTVYTDYQSTDTFAERENLYFKSGYDFQKYYGSQAYKSAYFYNSTIFLQKEVQKDELDSRYPDWKITTDPDRLYLIGKIIAYATIKLALEQFDFTELPKPLRGTILSDIDTRKAKGMVTEDGIKLALAKEFDAKARKFMMELEMELNEDRNSGEYVINENLNTSDDKSYLAM